MTFTFDDASQTTGIHHHTSGGTLIASYGYAYNDAGVPTSVVEGSGDRVTWSYDATWRLTRASWPCGSRGLQVGHGDLLLEEVEAQKLLPQ